MAVRASSTSKAKAQQLDLGLALHASAQRVFALLKERDRLVRLIEKKKATLGRAVEQLQHTRDVALEQLQPLAHQHGTISRELRGLFDELLAPGRLSARARKEVTKVLRTLEGQGTLDPAPGPEDTEESEPPWADEEPPHTAGRGASSSESRGQRDLASAAQHGQTSGRDSLRNVFRRLVHAIHPDRARHEPDRQQRTEAMKAATQAYESGDLAKLLALEKTWSGTASASADDDARRIRELERMNRELRAQAAELNRELRRVQRSAPESAFGLPLDMMMMQAQAELADLTVVRDFVRSFRDGTITLAEFVRGPNPVEFVVEGDADADELELEKFLNDLAEEFFGAPEKAPARSARRPRAPKAPKAKRKRK